MKILLADDHQLFSDGLCSILMESNPENEVELVYNGKEALLKVSKCSFDIALVDLRLPEMDGFSLLEELSKTNCMTPVIIISASEDPDDIHRAISLGAMGFVPKSASGQQIVETINHVLISGEITYPGVNLDVSINNKLHWASKHNISSRQLKVLRLMRKGLSNNEIATHLYISRSTVKSHVAAISDALSTKSRTEAIQMANHLGLD